MESKANPQTKASAKWNKKAGYVAKSYKLKKDTVEAFAEACKKDATLCDTYMCYYGIVKK